jgi:tRNA (guanine37-N1)-methyltransferase
MKAVKAEPLDAEKVRKKLSELGMFNSNYYVKRDEKYVYFPVNKEFESKEFEIVEIEMKERNNRKKLRDYLHLENLRSFDVIGDIAIVEIPEEYFNLEKEIGEAILNSHKNINTVLGKDSSVHGEYRVRNTRYICGEDKTETLHKEKGVKLKVDVSKVYFSPRLSRERERILEQVEDNETILGLFSGVGPFPLVIAKHKNVKAYSIELNPIGHKYAVENIKLNKLQDKVVAVEGDVREVLKRKEFYNIADRVTMPLPKDAINFLDCVASACKKNAIIHFYAFSKAEDLPELKQKILSLLGRPAEIILTRKVRKFSPEVDQYSFDIKITN